MEIFFIGSIFPYAPVRNGKSSLESRKALEIRFGSGTSTLCVCVCVTRHERIEL